MKIALPVAEGRLCTHFGHCEEFLLVDADGENKTILSKVRVQAPPHEPGLLPRWLAEKGVTCVIAGGMGGRAQELFCNQGITVVTGATPKSPEELVTDYLEGRLETGPNACDH
ncbi:MAG: NifB/NifX family molybdenum-iron cluster-binding protein [Spirochaetes bacterium]|nr:NifB/NifX family molybdenum-iron cluster-binding protein [Spirochaetota bacterium]